MPINVFDIHMDIWSDVFVHRKRGEKNIILDRHLDRFKRGHVMGGVFNIWINTDLKQIPKSHYGSIFDEMLQMALEELEENKMLIKIIHDAEELKNSMKQYPLSVMMGVEGLTGLNGRPEMIETLYAHGFRHFGLTWNEENDYATGLNGDPNRGLTTAGKELLKWMSNKNLIIDLSHCNEKTFWDVMEIWDGKVVASHSNAKGICDVARNLSDQQILAIGQKKGKIGLNAHGTFVNKDPQKRHCGGLAEHAAYISNLIGPEHLSCGFDFFEYLDTDPDVIKAKQNGTKLAVMKDCTEIPNFEKALFDVGFLQKDIETIFFGLQI